MLEPSSSLLSSALSSESAVSASSEPPSLAPSVPDPAESEASPEVSVVFYEPVPSDSSEVSESSNTTDSRLVHL